MRPILRLLMAAALLSPAAANAACQVENRAVIPLDVQNGAIAVPLQVNGIAGTFVLDTGAVRSMVTEEAVQRLSLARDEWVGTTMSGIGGIERRPNANPRSISLGGVPLVRHTLTHDTSLTVGIIPRTRIGSLVIDGLLGRDFLSLFDLDLNLPARSLTLYQVQDCSGRFLPWTDNYAVIPVTAPAGQALVVPVSVDGKPLQALLDSGASSSLIDAPGMFRLGLQQASLNGDPAEQITGIGTRTVTEYRHTFHSLQVGAEIIDRPTIWVAPIRIRPFADMLLGADWLSGRRVWVSFATKQVFVSRALSSN